MRVINLVSQKPRVGVFSSHGPWSARAANRTPAILSSRIWLARSPVSAGYASKSYPDHAVVTMPALSPTMTAGNIGAWQKQPGDSISPGDVLVEIETDKAQMDFEYQEEGVLAKILKDSGEKDVAVGNPIAVMIEEGADISAFESFSLQDAGGDKEPKESSQGGSQATGTSDSGSETSPEAHSAAADKTNPAKKSEAANSEPEPSKDQEESSTSRLEPSLSRQEQVSPRAKALALKNGIPLKEINGTGRGGVVTEEDVRKYKPSANTSTASATSSSPPIASYDDEKPSSMRKTIAERLQKSKQVLPHYYVQSAISVSKLLKLRQALNTAAEGKYKLSVNDFMIKAVAIACKKVSAVNSSWRDQDGVIRKFNTVDVSVAVATPIGLMTPIVHNADLLGLEAISAAVKELGAKARDGKLKPEQYTGGTITISNLGMNAAVERFTAIINPPQGAIAAIGAVKKVPVPLEDTSEGPNFAWDEQIVISTSFDHRVIDGAVGAEWMKELKKVIENPLNMLL